MHRFDQCTAALHGTACSVSFVHGKVRTHFSPANVGAGIAQSVYIVTDYGLDRGSISVKGSDFSLHHHHMQSGCAVRPASYSTGTGNRFPKAKRSEHEDAPGHSPPSTAESKNAWIFICSVNFDGVVHQHKNNLSLPMLFFWVRGIYPKRWYLPTSLHGVTTQENNADIFTAMRTSNLNFTFLFTNLRGTERWYFAFRTHKLN
jgi:hypothetical protein